MTRARAQYHNVVKQVKQNQNVIKRDKLANALLQDRSLWSEIRKSIGKCNTIPNMVDGEIDDYCRCIFR